MSFTILLGQTGDNRARSQPLIIAPVEIAPPPPPTIAQMQPVVRLSPRHHRKRQFCTRGVPIVLTTAAPTLEQMRTKVRQAPRRRRHVVQPIWVQPSTLNTATPSLAQMRPVVRTRVRPARVQQRSRYVAAAQVVTPFVPVTGTGNAILLLL